MNSPEIFEQDLFKADLQFAYPLSMNRNVGQASRLPRSETPTERNRSRWRARWAGGTPALRWARRGSWSQCMPKSEWRLLRIDAALKTNAQVK